MNIMGLSPVRRSGVTAGMAGLALAMVLAAASPAAATSTVSARVVNDTRVVTGEVNGAVVEVEGLEADVGITGAETIDLLRIVTLGGADEVDDDVRDVIVVAVDLGSGQ